MAPPTTAALAGNSAVRTVLQGLAVVAILAGALAIRDLLDAGPFDPAAIARAGATAAGMAVLAYVGRLVISRRVEPLPTGLDALVRAGRTLLAGAVTAAAAAVVEAVRAYVIAGGRFDATAITQVALTAAGMAVLAYIHRTAIDPSPMPSALPPGPTAHDGPAGTMSAPRAARPPADPYQRR
jgi:hypothetical protein